MIARGITFARLLWADSRTFVVAAQLTYLFFGIRSGFDVTWLEVAIALVTAIGAEYVFSRVYGKKMGLPLSACATAFGIGMYFRATHAWLFLVPALLAIASKYIIQRPGGGHIFNPSNFGIIVLVFLFPAATTIEFTQWGSDPAVYAFVTVICLLVAFRAGVIDLALSFLASYTALLLILLPYFPYIFSVHHYGIIGPSLVVFATLMITDPRSIPKGLYPRMLHGIVVATLFFLLELVGIRYALFLAVPIAALLNLAAEQLYAWIRIRYAQPWYVHSHNVLVAATVLPIAAIVFLCFAPPQRQFSTFALSPSFILQGVESGELLRGSATSRFVDSKLNVGSDSLTNGGAWGDFDQDGYDDLFVPNLARGSTLYRNHGGTSFEDVTEAIGLPRIIAYSGYFADYDDDGRTDLFIVQAGYRGGVRVFRNTKTGFEEVTASVGFADTPLDTRGGGALSFSDLDGDGDLDIVLATTGLIDDVVGPWKNSFLKSLSDPRFLLTRRILCDENRVHAYLEQYDLAMPSTVSDNPRDDRSRACLLIADSENIFSWNTSPGVWRSTKPLFVRVFLPGSTHLFENRSDKYVEHTDFNQTFSTIQHRETDFVHRHGTPLFDAITGRYFQPISFDYDEDGIQDILMSVDFGSPVLMKGTGHLGFREYTKQSGINYSGNTMGVDVADYDHDGIWDFVMTNSYNDFLFDGKGDGTFELSSQSERITPDGFSWGTSFLDYDLDGWEDLIVTNGDGLRLTLRYPDPKLGRSLFKMDELYRNRHGTFEQVSNTELPADALSGKGLAVSDYNNDGAPDVFIGNLAIKGRDAQRNLLWRNTTTDAHWLKVSLRGRSGHDNYFGVGATVTVTAGDLVQRKIVFTGSSFYSQNSSRLSFGLGDFSGMVDIRVVWPSGETTVRRSVEIDQEVLVQE